jgi:hypothetical protein
MVLYIILLLSSCLSFSDNSDGSDSSGASNYSDASAGGIGGNEARRDRIEEVPGFGLEVRSEPEGATLYIDGIKRGRTPLYIEELTRGRHIVTLEREMYRAKKVTVNYNATGKLLLHLTLADE